MEVPSELRFTSENEWVRLEDGEATVGISDYAQDQLGDVVYVELPEVGRALQQGETFGVIESVKAVSDLFSPVSGEVTARNEALADAPEQVNQSPYDAGWMIRVRVTDPAEVEALMDAAAYRAHVAEQE